MRKNIFIGTSGYNYWHWWDGVFYPADLPQSKWLEYYAKYFDTVELNVTFYRLPQKKTFENWYKRTAKNFLFVAKGSRFITHIKKLKDCAEPLKIFFENVSALKEKLGAVLWQLPPGLKANKEKLSEFCRLLKKTMPKIVQAFEFRNESWFNNEIYEILRKYNFPLCIAHSPRPFRQNDMAGAEKLSCYSSSTPPLPRPCTQERGLRARAGSTQRKGRGSPDWPCVEEITANSVYLRFHGGESLYGSNYSDEELKSWAKKAKKWLNEGKTVYAYFNNDAYGYAVKNALRLKELVNQ